MSAIRYLILALLFVSFLTGPALAERRVALAIGNANYTSVNP